MPLLRFERRGDRPRGEIQCLARVRGLRLYAVGRDDGHLIHALQPMRGRVRVVEDEDDPGWPWCLRFFTSELSVLSVVRAANIRLTTEDTEGTEGISNRRFAAAELRTSVLSVLSVVRSAYVRFTTEDTEGTEGISNRRFAAVELRPSVLSVVRAAYIRLNHGGHGGHGGDLEPEVRGGQAPSLRALRGPRSAHPFDHGGHGGHGGNRRFAATKIIDRRTGYCRGSRVRRIQGRRRAH